MLFNGFGEHNIQGIGDKHIPLIHNVMNTDLRRRGLRPGDRLPRLLFNSEVGRRYLAGPPRRPGGRCEALPRSASPASATCSAAIKIAKYHELGPDDVDRHRRHRRRGDVRERAALAPREVFPAGFDEVRAGEVFGQHLLGAGTDNLAELTRPDRERIFNLGYYTWVEQQGVRFDEFQARRQTELLDRNARDVGSSGTR